MIRHLFSVGCVARAGLQLAALTALLGWLGSALAADDYNPNIIRRLDSALKAKPDPKSDADLTQRRDLLKSIVSDKDMRDSDLRLALSLDSWQDQAKDDAVRAIDNPVRQELIDRFTRWVNGLLKPEAGPADPLRQLAAVTVVGEMGISMNKVGERKVSLAADFTPTLAALVTENDTDPAVRQAAARALGRIFPEAKSATDALAQMLARPGRQDRRAAADGLAEMLRVLVELKTGSSPKVEVDDPDIVNVAQLVTTTVGPGLTQNDPEVRLVSLEAVRLAALLLGRMGEALARDLPPGGRPPTSREQEEVLRYRMEVDAKNKAMQPLSEAIARQAPAVAASLQPQFPTELRLRAGLTLAEIGNARTLLAPKEAAPPARVTEKGAAAPAPAPAAGVAQVLVVLEEQAPEAIPDFLAPGLGQAVTPLIGRLQDPDYRVRIAALEALITLGRLASPAAPAATAALSDPNHFVRWAAVRLLGKIGPLNTPQEQVRTFAALTLRLDDPDLDVRKAAASTLGTFGPTVAAAARPLGRQVEFGDAAIRDYLANWPPPYGRDHRQEVYADAESRLAAIKALQAIGIDAIVAQGHDVQRLVNSLTRALQNRDGRVRAAAAGTLAQFGPRARSATGALQTALVAEARMLAEEPEPEKRKKHGTTRQAISDALLAVTAAD